MNLGEKLSERMWRNGPSLHGLHFADEVASLERALDKAREAGASFMDQATRAGAMAESAENERSQLAARLARVLAAGRAIREEARDCMRPHLASRAWDEATREPEAASLDPPGICTCGMVGIHRCAIHPNAWQARDVVGNLADNARRIRALEAAVAKLEATARDEQADLRLTAHGERLVVLEREVKSRVPPLEATGRKLPRGT